MCNDRYGDGMVSMERIVTAGGLGLGLGLEPDALELGLGPVAVGPGLGLGLGLRPGLGVIVSTTRESCTICGLIGSNAVMLEDYWVTVRSKGVLCMDL